MEKSRYDQMQHLGSSEAEQEKSVEYLAQRMKQFLRKNERVVIAFPDHASGTIGDLFGRAVLRCEAVPVYWEDDFRWKSLLRLAFSSHCGTIIGAPLIILGLTKLSRIMGTPLYIRNVVLAGYPSSDWMIEGICRWLDCKIWGCFDPGAGAVIAGFSCAHSLGVHLRKDTYCVRIEDELERPLPDGVSGEIVMYPVQDPSLRYRTGYRARLEITPCQCGCPWPRLMDFVPGRNINPTLMGLGEQMHYWTSILDCKITKGTYGLEMEVITFPGEKLPKFPNCAKLVVRAWEPDRDCPFEIVPPWKYAENH